MFYFKQLFKSSLQNVIFPILYSIYKKRKIVSKRVVFVDSSNTYMPVDFKLVKEALIKENYEIYEVYNNFADLNFLQKIKVVNNFYKICSTANVIIMCNFYLPVSSCNIKRETVVIQLWHGCGAYKKFGYDSLFDTPKGYYGNISKNYDLVTVSSEHCVKSFLSAFRLKNQKVKSFGVSRTDLLYDNSYKIQAYRKLYKEYPNAMNKKIILWAPTFRGYASKGELIGIEEIEHLKNSFPEYFIISRLHPKIQESFSINNSELNAIEILLVSDILISDYSSIIFEFSLLNKPICLLIKDFQSYINKRGFYLNIDLDLPFTKVYNYQGLCKWLTEVDFKANYKKFNKKYVGSCDGNSTKRIIDYIKEI